MEKSISIPVQIDLKYVAMILATFLFVTASQFPSLFLIYNMCDCGYFIVNQELAAQLGIQHIKVVPWWWFSDVLGAWWLKLSDSYGLWGAKVGGAIITGLTGAITAHTLFQLYKPTLGALFIVSLGGLCMQSELINYLSAPTFLYSIFCYYFLKLHLDPSKQRYLLLAGFFFVLLTFSRMPMVLTLFVLPVCYLFCRKEARLLYCIPSGCGDSGGFQDDPPISQTLRERGLSYLKLGAVILAIFFLFTLYLNSQKLLTSYLFFEPHSKDHTYLSLLQKISSHFIEKIPSLFCCASFAVLLYFLIEKRLLSKKIALPFFAIIALFSIGLAIFYLNVPEVKKYLHVIRPDSFDIYLLLVSLVLMSTRMLRKTITLPEIVLIILAIFLPLLRVLGSANGLKGSNMTGLLLFGCVYILLHRIAVLYNCKAPLACLGAVLAFLMVGKFIKETVSTYPSSVVTITNQQIARMEGLYVHPSYAKQVGELVCEMEKYSGPTDRVLACPYIPLVYYASHTLPLGNHSCLFFLDFDQFTKKLDLIASLPPPAFIVRPKFFTSPHQLAISQWSSDPLFLDELHHQTEIFQWSDNPIFLDHLHRKLFIFEEKIIKKWNARLIWSNDSFELLVPNPRQT